MELYVITASQILSNSCLFLSDLWISCWIDKNFIKFFLPVLMVIGVLLQFNEYINFFVLRVMRYGKPFGSPIELSN